MEFKKKRSLSSWQQCVSVRNTHSQLSPVTSGAPQGSSILGPLLFAIYMNNLPKSVTHSQIFMYADDTKCGSVVACPGISTCTPLPLQLDINSIQNWGSSHTDNILAKAYHIYSSLNEHFHKWVICTSRNFYIYD